MNKTVTIEIPIELYNLANESENIQQTIIDLLTEKYTLLPIAEAERLLSLPVDTIRRDIHRKKIEAVKRGREWYIDKNLCEKHYKKT